MFQGTNSANDHCQRSMKRMEMRTMRRSSFCSCRVYDQTRTNVGSHNETAANERLLGHLPLSSLSSSSTKVTLKARRTLFLHSVPSSILSFALSYRASSDGEEGPSFLTRTCECRVKRERDRSLSRPLLNVYLRPQTGAVCDIEKIIQSRVA